MANHVLGPFSHLVYFLNLIQTTVLYVVYVSHDDILGGTPDELTKHDKSEEIARVLIQ